MDDHAAAEHPGPRPSAPLTTVEAGATSSAADEDRAGRVILRTVYGGPTPQDGIIEEVARIRRVLRDEPFSYDLDLVLMIGGDVTPGSGPSGLRSPRVSLARRTATAEGRVEVSPEVVALLRGEGVPKGDALGVARVAGIMAAKRTPDLVPLCHPLAISGVDVALTVVDDAVEITAGVRTTDRTGVEMEALTAVTVAALTVVDMVKAVDKHARITDVEVVAKSGGRSGDWSTS